ncbi:MAG: ribosome maturation factor RimM [Synergistaceae bacterium]|jgi:16S rRNA processing protein RimM|nr:ribosome maturation factor RimM [Synergistaceae bacterium]
MWTSSKNRSPGDGEKILVGCISSAHGVKGEVQIIPLTDFPERFQRMKFLDLYSEGVFVRTLRVTSAREYVGKGKWIVGSELSDRTEAERCVGMSILIDSEERVPLPEDDFWVDDLIGLSVQDKEGNALGVVEEFISSGGHEVYEIKDKEGKLHYIPAVENFVKDIDLNSRKIVVELIEGLW